MKPTWAKKGRQRTGRQATRPYVRVASRVLLSPRRCPVVRQRGDRPAFQLAGPPPARWPPLRDGARPLAWACARRQCGGVRGQGRSSDAGAAPLWRVRPPLGGAGAADTHAADRDEVSVLPVTGTQTVSVALHLLPPPSHLRQRGGRGKAETEVLDGQGESKRGAPPVQGGERRMGATGGEARRGGRRRTAAACGDGGQRRPQFVRPPAAAAASPAAATNAATGLAASDVESVAAPLLALHHQLGPQVTSAGRRYFP